MAPQKRLIFSKKNFLKVQFAVTIVALALNTAEEPGFPIMKSCCAGSVIRLFGGSVVD